MECVLSLNQTTTNNAEKYNLRLKLKLSKLFHNILKILELYKAG